MKKLWKLLALTLAAAMLLSTAALADDQTGGQDEGGPRLVMEWLDWNDNGQCYASEDALNPENPGAWDLGYDPARGDHVIFFILDGGKKTPVTPTGDGSIAVNKVEKDSIAPNAKQSNYYVFLEMKEFKDGAVTAKYKNETLTFPVKAELPDVGFYTAPEAKPGTLLKNDTDPTALTDMTAYLINSGTDETHGRHVTDVRKIETNGTPSRWDLEKVNDTTWKIVINGEYDDVGVNVNVDFQDAEGNTYTEERGIGFVTDYGPELWLRWLDYNDEGLLDVLEGSEAYGGFTPHPGQHCNLIFYTCEDDGKGGQKLTPVPGKDLVGSEGVNIISLQTITTDEIAPYSVEVSVDEWEKNYTISYKGYTMRFDSNLYEVDIYTKPEVSAANAAMSWRFSPCDVNDTVYVCGAEDDAMYGRHMTGLALTKDGENNDKFSLEKISDSVYKLTRNTIDTGDIAALLDLTWTDENGETYTEPFDVWSAPNLILLASEEPVWKSGAGNPAYDGLKDKLSDGLTMKVGEEKTVHLHRCFIFDGKSWVVTGTNAAWLVASDPALKLAVSDTSTAEYTVSCDVPGTYTISLQSPVDYDLKLYHEDGKEYTAQDYAKFEEDVTYNPWSGELVIYMDEEGTEVKTFEEVFPGETYELTLELEDANWGPITVTVESAAPEKLPFTDVPETQWYVNAVRFVNSKGLMNGSSATKFNPTGKITGAEFAQILYNKAGKPAAAEGASFQGVSTQWYAPAVLWAAGEGIITDTGDTAVEPAKDLTRQQIALMLYNAMGKPAGTADLSAFTDADQIAAWAKPAMEWAVSAKVFQGSNGKLTPASTATRAEVAQILMNYFG